MRNKHKLTLTKKYGLTQNIIAKLFGYSSVQSFRNSSAKDRVMNAVEQIISTVESSIISKIEE